ncbi:hypothetical protein K402DRAFT_139473 [Aulographum hederae CBS 113979]|uniref:Secreted protein n=1 Tax=Aulographum hederae CBS 113979 TaxID=1176131 RepID=A0A6G1GUX7_9PEZI|nr:hypothetical protein K402DRAFT_139473 [Aulographum hederae CBS 113979]
MELSGFVFALLLHFSSLLLLLLAPSPSCICTASCQLQRPGYTRRAASGEGRDTARLAAASRPARESSVVQRRAECLSHPVRRPPQGASCHWSAAFEDVSCFVAEVQMGSRKGWLSSRLACVSRQ